MLAFEYGESELKLLLIDLTMMLFEQTPTCYSPFQKKIVNC